MEVMETLGAQFLKALKLKKLLKPSILGIFADPLPSLQSLNTPPNT